GGYYYMFYKWKVRQDCASALEPVTAVFNGTGLPAGAAINAPSTSICPGENVVFTATPTNGGLTPVFQWQVNGANVGTNSNTYATTTLNNGDVVTCIITSSDTCTSNNPATSNSINITVFSAPSTPVIVQSGADLNSNASSGNQWYFNNSPIGGANGITYTPTQNGSYYVIVTDGNGCVTDTSNIINVTGIGISENEIFSISIYPNPADEQITLSLKGITGTVDVSLENMLGERIINRTNVSATAQLDVSSLAEGMYLLKIRSDKTRVYRVVIKHGNK
ncbi:MAG: T9SS type A sorting domain-containing protein, partial [Flavobacteriales bacterium]